MLDVGAMREGSVETVNRSNEGGGEWLGCNFGVGNVSEATTSG